MRVAEQAQEVVSIKVVDGIYMKATRFPRAGTSAEQHSHVYDHISHISAGAARVFAGGVLLGDFAAGASLTIKAHVEHEFLTLLDNTVVLCIHNADHADPHGEPLVYQRGES